MNVPAGPAAALWCDPDTGVVARIDAALRAQGLHPARAVVLVPYAQLMKVAREMWACSGRAGFVPRFETTRNWTGSVGGFLPAGYDLHFDMARDLVTAQSLLAQAGLGSERLTLAGRLVELALQLAPLAAAELPAERAACAERLAPAVDFGQESQWLDTERRLVRIAVAWVANSAYATDLLFGEALRTQIDALIVLEGFQADPLAQKLVALWGDRAMQIALDRPDDDTGKIAVHAAADAEDEADLAAACVLRQLGEGRAPVALVATDRALTRRISARLVAQGLVPHDETGWKLSTTRAAATLMAALRACAHDASSDQVLDWVKGAPADGALVQLLEAGLRREGQRDWLAWCSRIARSERPQDAELQSFCAAIEARRAPLISARPLPEWLPALRALLQADGRWEALAADAAGARVLAALWLEDEDPDLAAGRHTLAEFTAWVRDVLEAASFVPSTVDQSPQVFVLPLHQLLGRDFGAVVIPGCDDRRLPASPEPPGAWSAAQRIALGLPSRERLEAAHRAAWSTALRTPHAELLWRRFDASGEPVSPSPLLQTVQLDAVGWQAGTDPRGWRTLPLRPTAPPLPSGALLPLQAVSATVYEDLRRCPYRFFALRQLGLRSADELDADVDKRDFGNWLHAVLGHFHQALSTAPTTDVAVRLMLMADAQQQATREYGLSEAEFLPFAAAWPAVRDGYLRWLAQHEADGTGFAEAEPWKEQPLGALKLIGRLDRIDRTAEGRAFVIDYKTESEAVTRERIKSPTEDTQLAFYAALMADDTLRAAYVNVGEKSGTQTVEQTLVVEARDALVIGLLDDFARIDAGAVLPALGEGTVCEHCAARGLCRKDFWDDAAGRPVAAADPTAGGEGS